MPASVISVQIADGLQELYEPHLPVDERHLDRFYESGRGYYPPVEAADERDRFAICLAGVSQNPTVLPASAR